jgi:hypothetical protein
MLDSLSVSDKPMREAEIKIPALGGEKRKVYG